MALNYAILFKTHYWDATLAARIGELRRVAPSANLFVFVDETSGPVEVQTTVPVIRRTVADVPRCGLAAVPPDAVFWYNNDYPLYLSAPELIGYDYVLMMEHDCVVAVDVDGMVAHAGAEGVDFAAAPVRTPLRDWAWLPTLNGVYDLELARASLNCTCLISRRAWMHLFARRLCLSDEYAAGTLQARRQPLPPPLGGVIESWPFGEGFMVTDLALHGFKVVDLAKFGDTSGYDWWPPFLLRDVAQSGKTGFFHPVLDEDRYIISLMRVSAADAADWFVPGSIVRTRLERCDPAKVAATLAKAFRDRNQFENIRRLRLEVAREQWHTLVLAHDACSVPHPSSCSQSTERPQWWQLDLERPHDVFEIRLAPHEQALPDEIRVSVSLDGVAWSDVGSLPAGAAFLSHPPLTVAFTPSRPMRHVKLTTYSAVTLRTGKLEAFVDV